MVKKGSLNLSIQMIVIIVIAFVVLGLGLGFVRSQFGSMEETAGTVQKQIQEQIMDDLRRGDKKLSFPATSLSVDKGGSKDIALGIKNTKAQGDLRYRILITVTEMQEGTVDDAELPDQVGFFYDEEESILPVTESRVHSVRIAGKGVKGTYLVKLVVEDLDATDPADVTYDQKTFFVNII